MYDPPGNFGYNDGLTSQQAKNVDTQIEKRKKDRENIRDGKVNENTNTQHIPATKKGSTSKSFFESVFSFGNNLSSVVPIGGTRRRRKYKNTPKKKKAFYKTSKTIITFVFQNSKKILR